jgi:hypothetical protein
MTQYALTVGSSFATSPAAASQNINWDCPTNPVLKNDLTAAASVVCYEIHDDNSALSSQAAFTDATCDYNNDPTITHDANAKIVAGLLVSGTGIPAGAYIASITDSTHFELSVSTTGGSVTNGTLTFTGGVSYSNTYSTLNRIYPNDTTVASYLENLENTPGYRIKCHIASPSTGQILASDFIDTNDYFVMIFADDYKKHHFARINEITTDDVVGDSFEFEPAYNGEIAEGTKFAIYKGPLLTDTSVIALMYGGQGSGSGSDSRHDIYTNCVRPLFYFYNDRLDKDNQLDHNTKYVLYYSRWDGSSEVLGLTHFVTESDYGLQVIDYGPYTTTAVLVDNNVTNDTPSASSGGVELYGSSTTSYTHTYTEWNSCFKNIQRTTDNKIAAQTSGSFTGPKRYIHYSDSAIKNNFIPRVMNISVFQSITKTGSYFEGKIVDPHKIMGLKIKKYDPIKVRHKIIDGTLNNKFNANLFGTYSGTSGANTITATALSANQDLRIILKNSSGEFELIRIGDYYYKLSAIAAPAFNSSTNSLEQVLTMSHHRKYDAAVFTSGNLAVSFSASTATRQQWGKITETLLVDFNIDTVVTHANADSREVAASAISYNGSALSDFDDSRINGLEIVLVGGEYSGHRIDIKYGDSVNGYVKLDTPRVTMYQKESLSYPNMLDYFNGSFYIDKILFNGIIENIEENIEEGVFFYKIYGRNNINKLLGPIINKNYLYSEDWVHSNHLNHLYSTSKVADANGVTAVGDATITVDSGNSVAIGDVIGLLDSDTAITLIGFVINRSDTVLTLEEGSLTVIPDNAWIILISNSDNKFISFGKAIQANSSASSTVTSLRGTANKGLFFNSGLKLTKVSGIPTTDGASLQGTSSYSNVNARGYYLNTISAFGDDLPYVAKLTDELSTSLTYSEVNTISSITNFEVVSIDSQEGETIIELAPNCPAILARMDNNSEDIRFRTFTATGLFVNNGSNYAANYTYEILLDYGGGGAVNAHGTIPRGTDLYKSDGTYIGKVERIEAYTYTAGSASATAGAGVLTYVMILKEPLKQILLDNTELYVSDKKNEHLYFLNTQGLGNGGYLHLVNSGLSTAQKPITFSYQENSTVDGLIASGESNVCNILQFGQPVYRYFNLQKGHLGSLYYMTKRLETGAFKSSYSRNRGNVSAYAYAYKSTGGAPLNINDHDKYNTIERTKQFKHETRGIFPASGSAYEDYTIHPVHATVVFPGLDKMPHYDSDGGAGHQDSAWDITLSNSHEQLRGYKHNAISLLKDRWEIIDPKMLRWFIFTGGDLWPDSMTRQHNLGFDLPAYDANLTARDLTNYSLIIKGETTKEKSNITHSNYLGSLSRETIIDDSFETLPIKSASISGNEMKRVGLMRLKELTFDWHFNLLDTELPPDFTRDGVGGSSYARFLPLEYTSFYSTIGSNITIANVGEYSADKTEINIANDNGSGGIIFGDGVRVFTKDGRYIGVGDSSCSTSKISLTAAAKLIDGALYVGNLHLLAYDSNSTADPSWRITTVSGRGGENSLWDIDTANSKPLMPTQGAIIRGAHPNGGTSANWDNNWDNGASTQDLSISGIIMPPVFQTGSSSDYLSPLNTTQKSINTAVSQQQKALHPSRLMNDLFNESAQVHAYRGCKAVVIGRYNIENKGEWKVDIGTVIDLGDTTAKLEPGSSNEWTFFYTNTQQKKYNGSAATDFNSQEVEFAQTKIDETAISASSPDTIADGIHFVIKPLLHVGNNIGCTSTYSHSNVHNPGTGANGAIKTLTFVLDAAANTDNQWLKYCPNLTGCYLVGTEAYETYSSTLNSAGSGGFESTWDDTDVADIGKAAVVSMEGTHPYKMHYIISHTITTSTVASGTSVHHLTVDNAGTMSQFYRVMQPAETCLWPNTPSQIDLYKMSSNYTKRPDSDEMFGDIGHINLWENGYVKGKKNEHGYNEAVQSMYVLVDMDNTESDAEFLVPRTHSTVFGSSKRFEPNNAYDVLLHDGNSKHRKTMTVQTATTNDCRLKFSDEFDKMVGIVSIGEIFTVNTPTPNKIQRPDIANIASSVTICQEAEQIINDLLETENITYTKTSKTFPYFIAPDFRGAELYSAVEFLANFKDKRIVITPDGIKLRPDTETLDYIDIKLNSKNDINIMDITKNESLFDHFNEINVYGAGFKTVRRDRKSINKRGKKTLEEIDDTLRTQQEVNERASTLMKIHGEDNYRITITCSGVGLELIKPGDIITLDFPEHRINKGKYLILEIKHKMYGLMELEVGKYNKGLSERFAEIIQTQKKTSAYLRADKFKTQTDTTDFIESFALKELRFVIKKTSPTGSPFTIGFNYAIDTLTTGGTNTGAPIGFNTSLGTVDTTTELDEDLV